MKYLSSLLPTYEPLPTQQECRKRMFTGELVTAAATQSRSRDDHVGDKFNAPKPHQILPINYLAPHTPYDFLLLVHDPGSGKTFIAYSLIVKYARLNEHTVVLSPMPTVLKDHLLEFNARRRYEPCIKNYFKCYSYMDVERFQTAGAPNLAHYRLLIADEVHTIYNNKNGVVYSPRYKANLALFNFCKRVSMKRLLMTATPQSRVVQYDENLQITQVMRLGATERVESLDDVKRLYGSTSVYRAPLQPYTKVVEMGEPYTFHDGVVSKTRVVVDVMRGYQKRRCDERRNVNDEIFCAPPDATLTRNYLHDHLYELSAVYHRLFEEMGLYATGDPARRREVVMFFNERVTSNGGNVRLREILKKWGFEEVVDVDAMLAIVRAGGAKRPRFCFVSGTLGHSCPKNINKLVEIVSHPNNMYGEYVQLVILSIKGAVGYNWKNIRAAHLVVNPLPAVMTQARGRCFRGETPFVGDENYVRVYFHLIECDNRVNHLRTLERRVLACEELDRVLDDVSIERIFAGDGSQPTSDAKFIYDSLYDGYACTQIYTRMKTIVQSRVDMDAASMPLRSIMTVASLDGLSRNDAMYALTRLIKTGATFTRPNDSGVYELGNYKNVLYLRNDRERSPLQCILSPVQTTSRPTAFAAVDRYFKRYAELAMLDDRFDLNVYLALPILSRSHIFEFCFLPGPLSKSLRLEILGVERNKYTVHREENRVVHRLLPYYHSKKHAIYIGAGGDREFVDGRWNDMAAPTVVEPEARRVRAPPAHPPPDYSLGWFFATTDDIVGSSTKRYSTRAPGKGQSVASIRTEDKLRYIDVFIREAARRMTFETFGAAVVTEWPALDRSDGLRAALGRLCVTDDFFVRLQRIATGFVSRNFNSVS